MRNMASRYLDELSSKLNQTVNFAVLDSLDALIIYRKEVRAFLKYDLHAGSKLPAYCTSLGKILLAGLNDDDLIKKISEMKLQRITPRTITSKKALFKDIVKAYFYSALPL